LNGTDKKSYGQILKSSAIIGGSSVLNIGFGIVRTKAMALFLGPAGVGLLGLYGSIADLARCLAGLGINGSGVRQIAEAVGTGDNARIARTVTTLRRVALCSGALGAVLLLALSRPVSWLTFGDTHHVSAVALLALVAFFGDVSAGQMALVQGMRRIADLARINVLGAFYGTAFSIVIVYFLREAGLVPSLVCVGAMGVLTSWWYARKIKVEAVRITLRQVIDEAGELLKLGVIFMTSALLTMGMAYVVRLVVLRSINLEAAGYYQAAWVLGGLYVGFILQAMGADFYPRLTAVANNHPECNRLVNEQTEVGLLMAGPGILGTLTFAPLIITLFYRADFAPAAEILRWICLGMMLRVVTWPMGFIIVAKGARKIFFWTEVLANAGYAGLVWAGVQVFGLKGTGIAFFALYLIHFTVVYLIVRRLSGFRWSSSNRQLALLFIPLVGVIFIGWYLLPLAGAVILGTVVTLPTGIYSLKLLCTLVPLDRLPRAAQKLVRLFRLAPANV
jgi:antigen flippase